MNNPQSEIRNPQSEASVASELWDYLSAHHRGASNAIKEADLARAHGLNSRVLQTALHYLIVDKRRPIASSCRPPYGVFIAISHEEKALAARQIEHRIIALARRLRALTDSPLVVVTRQTALFQKGDSHV